MKSRKVPDIFDGCLNILAYLAAFIIIATMLVISTEVIMRPIVARYLSWTVEVSGYGLLFIAFLGAAWLERKDGHAKMDIVFTRFNKKARVVLDIVISVMCATGFLIITWYGIKVCWGDFQAGYHIASKLRPPTYMIRFVIPLGALLLSIQFLRRIYGHLRRE